VRLLNLYLYLLTAPCLLSLGGACASLLSFGGACAFCIDEVVFSISVGSIIGKGSFLEHNVSILFGVFVGVFS